MIIYKVVNERDKSIAEYFLSREKALQCLDDSKVWFIDNYHVESEVLMDCVLNT